LIDITSILKDGICMGFKSIELQIAIPRSQDAGKMQEQMMRQGQQFQDTLTKQQLREEIVNRGKVNEYENVQDKNDQEQSQQQENQEQNKEKEKEKIKSSIEHPFLGTNIDFSG